MAPLTEHAMIKHQERRAGWTPLSTEFSAAAERVIRRSENMAEGGQRVGTY
jgi:hypothetical protein